MEANEIKLATANLDTCGPVADLADSDLRDACADADELGAYYNQVTGNKELAAKYFGIGDDCRLELRRRMGLS